MTDAPSEDFLDGPTYADAPPASAPEPPRRGLRPAVVTAGLLVAGLVLGGVGVAAVHLGQGSSSAAGLPTASGGQGLAGQGFPGQGPPPGGRLGGFAGEQHVVGTLAAVNGSNLTVTTSAGTSAYTIDADTTLVKDGQRVASLSAMQVGDPVLVHVYPRNGSTHVEIVIDGADDTTSDGTITHT